MSGPWPRWDGSTPDPPVLDPQAAEAARAVWDRLAAERAGCGPDASTVRFGEQESWCHDH